MGLNRLRVVHLIIQRTAAFEAEGIEIRTGVLGTVGVADIRAEVSVGHELASRTGIRNAEKKFRCIARLATDPAVFSIAESLLGSPVRLVRALLFDKTAERNWFVAWHQDRTVTLNQRFDMDGWGPWTRKDGIHHVQPPRAVLDQMVTIRLHLDDADQEGGCLCVIPGSHRFGVLAQDEVGRVVTASTPRLCVVAAGDAVIMHPLVLHSSMKSRRPTHRRVVHLEYSSYALPPGISWA
jgi:hypothetical protein